MIKLSIVRATTMLQTLGDNFFGSCEATLVEMIFHVPFSLGRTSDLFPFSYAFM